MRRSLSVGFVEPTPPDIRPRRSATVQPPHRSLADVPRRARLRAACRASDAAPQPRHPCRPRPGVSRPQPAHAQSRFLLSLDLRSSASAWPATSRVSVSRLAWSLAVFRVFLRLNLRGLGVLLRLLAIELVLLDLRRSGALRFFLAHLVGSLRVTLGLLASDLLELTLFLRHLGDIGVGLLACTPRAP